MEPGTVADARKAQEEGPTTPPSAAALLVPVGVPARNSTRGVPEHPAACEHRADVIWLAHRLRISERRVADLGRQKKHLERRLRKALRKRKR